MDTKNLSPEDQRKAEKAMYERTDSWLSRKFKEQSLDEYGNYGENNPPVDSIVRPSHYNIGGIEPAEFMESLGIAEDYYAGNIIKYASRYKRKNGVEDVRKAKQYCKMLIDLLESQT